MKKIGVGLAGMPLIAMTLIVLMSLGGCGDSEQNEADSSAPEVSFAAPSDGEQIDGPTTVEVDGPEGLEIELFIDGQSKGLLSETGTYEWYPLGQGTATLEAVGSGDAGQTVEASIEVELMPRCGDGILDSAEVCDDGNLDAQDGCSPACEFEVASGETLWSERFGDGESQDGYAIALDAAGNAYVTGIFEGTVDFGGGPLTASGENSFFVAKFDPFGAHLWSKVFNDIRNFRASIGFVPTVDAQGNLYLAGSFGGTIDLGGGELMSAGDTDLFLAKFQPDGEHVWSKRFGGTSNDKSLDIATDADGHVYLLGTAISDINMGGENLSSWEHTNLVLAKYDADGEHVWSTRFEGEGLVLFFNIEVSETGHIYLAGDFSQSIYFGEDRLSSSGVTDRDIGVAKLDLDGNHQWSKSFGGDRDEKEYGEALAVDADGNLVISGRFREAIDFGGGLLEVADSERLNEDIFLARLGPDGSHLWSKRFGDTQGDAGKSVRVDGSGNVYLSGYFRGDVNLGAQTPTGPARVGFTAKYAPDGTSQWVRSYPGADGADSSEAIHMAVDEAGSAYITGTFRGTVDFGTGPLETEGFSSDDVFLMRLAP